MTQKNRSKSLVVYSDIHVGSKYSICSESPTKDKDADYRPSPNQKTLLRGWEECIDQIQQRPNALVINGEPIDGDNKKTLGDSVWSVNINDQMDDAVKLLKMIKHDSIYFVRGSGYHIAKDGTNFEETIAERVGAVKYRSIMGYMTLADYEATFELFGKHIHFTHHLSYSGWWLYRTTPMAKELVKMHFAHKANGFHTDVIVRSHVHYFVGVTFPHTRGFSSPAWKFPDGFMYRSGEPELPTIGNVEIIIESNGKIMIEPHLVELDFRKPVIHI